MVYLKSFGTGLIASVGAMILFVIGYVGTIIVESQTGPVGATAGGISAVPILVLGLVVFAAVFMWRLRRTRRASLVQ